VERVRHDIQVENLLRMGQTDGKHADTHHVRDDTREECGSDPENGDREPWPVKRVENDDKGQREHEP